MRHGSLFSGIGGFDLAAQWMGRENIFQVEWDSFCQKVLAKNFPNVKRYGDIREFDGKKYRGLIDILTGGFPCQDLSLAGKRAGLTEGTRSGLWFEFARAIEELQPKLVVIENVRGILSAKASNGMEYDIETLDGWGGQPVFTAIQAVLGSLADLGYDARWCGVRAADAGAPHNRFRVFIIAYPSNT